MLMVGCGCGIGVEHFITMTALFRDIDGVGMGVPWYSTGSVIIIDQHSMSVVAG